MAWQRKGAAATGQLRVAVLVDDGDVVQLHIEELIHRVERALRNQRPEREGQQQVLPPTVTTTRIGAALRARGPTEVRDR